MCLYVQNVSRDQGIVKTYDQLKPRKCTDSSCNCKRYHCPLCPPKLMRPTTLHKARAHIDVHWDKKLAYKGRTTWDSYHTFVLFPNIFICTKVACLRLIIIPHVKIVSSDWLTEDHHSMLLCSQGIMTPPVHIL